MTIRKTTLADLAEVMDIYAYAREQMAAAGNCVTKYVTVI